MSVDLSGNYSRFVSDSGVDDEVAGKGSVQFQVWGDGPSCTTARGERQVSVTAIDISVAGVQQLNLS